MFIFFYFNEKSVHHPKSVPVSIRGNLFQECSEKPCSKGYQKRGEQCVLAAFEEKKPHKPFLTKKFYKMKIFEKNGT